MQKVTLDELRAVTAEYSGKGLNRIYLHWSAGHYNQIFADYHISIDGNGEIYYNHALTERLAATYRRNTNSVSVSVMCCYNAKCWYSGNKLNVDLGAEPPSDAQIKTLAEVVCALSDGLKIPIDEYHVMTHAECAMEDGYFVGSGDEEERWDLLYLSNDAAQEGGNAIREMALAIQNEH